MTLADFRKQLTHSDHQFVDTLAFIEKNYQFQPTAFNNGYVVNITGQNEGSCKVLALAILEGFTHEEALLAFAEHYRSVLATPEGNDHQNIRALQKSGLQAVSFDSFPLIKSNN
ncbi:HopJ type III effector protein [Neisseria sp. Ec49-e6-T10]|uniref:HopJ type III effector protein n=1 Tax=Neisseria sp. Ec49-e6-T10 TaxID=3140744 RepID=UPI003EBD5D17